MNTSRASSCKGKKRHRTMQDANCAVRMAGEAKGDLRLVAYKCRFCPFWHVGHPPRSRQKQLAYDRILKLIDKANGKKR